MVWVTSAEYVDGHRLRIRFNDGQSGIVDLRPMIASDHRPIVRALEDIGVFKRFHVAHDTVVWDNGLDLAPEYLNRLLASQLGSEHA